MSDRALRVIRGWVWAVVFAGFLAAPPAWGQAPSAAPPAGEQLRDAPRAADVPDNKADPATRPSLAREPATRPATTNADDPIARIRDEGLNRSHVMETLSYLTDVIGPRLTGSP